MVISTSDLEVCGGRLQLLISQMIVLATLRLICSKMKLLIVWGFIENISSLNLESTSRIQKDM